MTVDTSDDGDITWEDAIYWDSDVDQLRDVDTSETIGNVIAACRGHALGAALDIDEPIPRDEIEVTSLDIKVHDDGDVYVGYEARYPEDKR